MLNHPISIFLDTNEFASEPVRINGEPQHTSSGIKVTSKFFNKSNYFMPYYKIR